MTSKTLTLKKPLSLAQQAKLYQAMRLLTEQDKKKRGKRTTQQNKGEKAAAKVLILGRMQKNFK